SPGVWNLQRRRGQKKICGVESLWPARPGPGAEPWHILFREQPGVLGWHGSHHVAHDRASPVDDSDLWGSHVHSASSACVGPPERVAGGSGDVKIKSA